MLLGSYFLVEHEQAWSEMSLTLLSETLEFDRRVLLSLFFVVFLDFQIRSGIFEFLLGMHLNLAKWIIKPCLKISYSLHNTCGLIWLHALFFLLSVLFVEPVQRWLVVHILFYIHNLLWILEPHEVEPINKYNFSLSK